MAKAAVRSAPAPYKRNFKRIIREAKSVLRHVTLWRAFWVSLIFFMWASVYWTSVSDSILKYRANQKPPISNLPPNAKFDVPTTLTYMKEKRLVVRTNLKNVFGIVIKNVGLGEEANKKLKSIKETMPVSSKLDKNIEEDSKGKLDDKIAKAGDAKPVESEWAIVKENLADAIKSYGYMLTVKVVSIQSETGKTVKMVVEDNGELVPYDKTDRILRWSTYINAASRKYGVDPAIIAAIIEQESGGNPTAGSHAGAIGLMQLMPRTARGLGVDPYDPAQNIDGGTHYYLYQFKRFGSMEQALAAYNSGPGNVLNGNYLYISETQRYIRNVPILVEKYRRIFDDARAANSKIKPEQS